MKRRRLERVAEAIREVVATAILFELKDPRVRDVTVLRVEVSGDLRHAKVYVSLMGDEKQQRLTMHGLQSARGFLQYRIARELKLRWTPTLQFVLDQGVKKSIAISKLIDESLGRTVPGEPEEPEIEEGNGEAGEPEASEQEPVEAEESPGREDAAGAGSA